MLSKNCISLRFLLMAIGFLAGNLEFAAGQSFSSGSNGSDGALNITTTMLFDPKSFNPPLDPDGDNVYHFTTITIAAGVTVTLSDAKLHGPFYWLATGAVQIDGTINLDGANGAIVTTIASRIPALPGAGGYPGGLGNYGTAPRTDGGGPGGGKVAGPFRGVFTGNRFLVPLIGGSGGAGVSGGAGPGGGGAGGGALLIASSIRVNINGKISAAGGLAYYVEGGNPGSGGGIRIAAPVIGGTGTLTALGGGGTQNQGLIRLEAFQLPDSLKVLSESYSSAPFGVFLPTNSTPPRLSVVSVAGVPVPPSPTVSFQVPDVTINSPAPVSFEIEGRNIPGGTTVNLYISSEDGAYQTLSGSLQGSQQTSTAAITATLPPGFSTAYVNAKWTQ